MTRNENWRLDVIDYDPFADDKDDGGFRIIEDKIVRCRVVAQCATCFQPTVPGTLTRVMKSVCDNKIYTTRDCQDCCDAMAAWPDDEAPMMVRETLRVAAQNKYREMRLG